MAVIDIRGCLHHHPLFQQLSDADLDLLIPHVREIRVERGRMLFQRGDACRGVHLVVTGMVKLAISGGPGSEKVVEIIRAGQSLGEAVMFLDRPYPVMAQALEDSLLLEVEKPALLDALERDPRFARAMLAGLSMRLHGLIRDVETYSTHSATQRVVAYLLQGVGPSEDATVSLPVNKNLIASRLNLTPETLSRVLGQMSAAGLLEVRGRDIHLLDADKLAALLQPA